MNFRNDTVVTQLWHAPGASKKFGASVDKDSIEILKKISENTDYLIVSSKNIVDYYCEAFQISKDKIKPLGLPRADYYFKNHNIENLRQNFNNKYNLESDKKIILYAPTLGFHWYGRVACNLSLHADGALHLYNNSGNLGTFKAGAVYGAGSFKAD